MGRENVPGGRTGRGKIPVLREGIIGVQVRSRHRTGKVGRGQTMQRCEAHSHEFLRATSILEHSGVVFGPFKR